VPRLRDGLIVAKVGIRAKLEPPFLTNAIDCCTMAIMLKIGVALLSILAVPALAQSTIKDALVKHWKTSGDFTIAVAKLMPADSYSFKPVPDELTFGQVLIQVGRANLGACALASGSKRPDVAPALVEEESGKQAPDKDSIVQFLSSSFDFCNQAVAGMTPEKLDAVVGPPNRKMTGYEWLWAYFTHTAHHRGQLEVYLRLKGIKPPDYVF
jgi:hypothetical protein